MFYYLGAWSQCVPREYAYLSQIVGVAVSIEMLSTNETHG